MAIGRFEVGTTTANMINVEEADLQLTPPDVDFILYPDAYVTGDGRQVGDGFSQCAWMFPFMTVAQYTTFKIAYCPNGQSAVVYIRTLTDTGSYDRYLAILQWPQNVRSAYRSGGYVGLTFPYTRLESV